MTPTDALPPPILAHGTFERDLARFRRQPRSLGVHLGSPDQAADRLLWSCLSNNVQRPGWILHVGIRMTRTVRIEDLGGWRVDRVVEALWAADAIRHDQLDLRTHAAIRRALVENGYDGIVYHNEGEAPGLAALAHEDAMLRRRLSALRDGSPGREDVRQAYLANLGKMRDLRRARCADSWIALDPSSITVERRLPWSGHPENLPIAA